MFRVRVSHLVLVNHVLRYESVTYGGRGQALYNRLICQGVLYPLFVSVIFIVSEGRFQDNIPMRRVVIRRLVQARYHVVGPRHFRFRIHLLDTTSASRFVAHGVIHTNVIRHPAAGTVSMSGRGPFVDSSHLAIGRGHRTSIFFQLRFYASFHTSN